VGLYWGRSRDRGRGELLELGRRQRQQWGVRIDGGAEILDDQVRVDPDRDPRRCAA